MIVLIMNMIWDSDGEYENKIIITLYIIPDDNDKHNVGKHNT